MTRPRCKCKIRKCLKPRVFRPDNCSTDDMDAIKLSPAQAEALRLKDVDGFDQTEAAKKMGISQSSFQRILSEARKKASTALFTGRVIKIAEE